MLSKGRNETAFVIFGEIGDGKSSVFEYLKRWIIGEQYCLTDSNINNVFGNFNSTRARKMLVVLEEAKDTKDNFIKTCGMIKDAITNSSFMCVKKGKEAVEETNYNNFVFLTNNKVPVQIEDKDRRYNVFRSSNCYQSNAEYFDSIHSIMDNQEYANKLLTYYCWCARF